MRALRLQMFIQLIVGTNSSDTVAGSLALPRCSWIHGDISPVSAFVIYIALDHLSSLWTVHFVLYVQSHALRDDLEQHSYLYEHISFLMNVCVQRFVPF